jgi:hypothetical protein
MGDPTSSYATYGIALRVSGALKLHHHEKVETPSVGFMEPTCRLLLPFKFKRLLHDYAYRKCNDKREERELL